MGFEPVVERHFHVSPLAHLGLEARAVARRGTAGIAMAEERRRVQLALRGEAGDTGLIEAVRRVAGVAPPLAAHGVARAGDATILWLGPDEWLVTAPGERSDLAARLGEVLGARHHAVTDVTDSRTLLRLEGTSARDLLAQGCSLDFHPSVFKPGQCAASRLALAQVLIHQLSEDAAEGPAYEIYVHRSYADYLWRWLESASEAYGFAVLAPV